MKSLNANIEYNIFSNSVSQAHPVKRLFLNNVICFLVVLLPGLIFSQANTFPNSGRVGIGTINPISILQIEDINLVEEIKFTIKNINATIVASRAVCFVANAINMKYGIVTISRKL